MGGTPDRVSLSFRICCTCQPTTSQWNCSGQILLITIQLVADDSAHNYNCHFCHQSSQSMHLPEQQPLKKASTSNEQESVMIYRAALGNCFSLNFPPWIFYALRRASPPILLCSLNSCILFSLGCHTLLAGRSGMKSFHSHKPVLLI